MIRQFAVSVAILLVAGALAWRIAHVEPRASSAEGQEGGEKTAEKKEHGAKKAADADDDSGLGRVKLTEKAFKTSGIVIDTAGPAKIRKRLPLYGKIAANEERMAKVLPRFPGVVKEVRKRLGDAVARGDVLAVVEGNESLKTYEIKAEIAGTIIKKDVSLGELVTDQSILFLIADLHTVWVDFNVYRDEFRLLHEGLPISISLGDGGDNIAATILYLSPFGAENTQTMLARAEIENTNGSLRPGLFVTGELVTAETDAPVAVKVSAIQTLENKPAVFVQEGDAFEARAGELGEHDAEFIEVISGLLPGDKYAATNSFVLKAELGKGVEDND